MRPHTHAGLLALLLTSLLVLMAPATAAATITGDVVTQEPVHLDGVTQALFPEGVLHVRGAQEDPLEATLTAERLTVTVDWQKGTRATVADREVRNYEETGRDVHHFQDATLDLRVDRDHPELLAMYNGQATATGLSQASAQVTVVEDRYLTRVGFSEDTQSNRDAAPGFWYRVDGPWVQVGALTQSTVDGDLDLFVNNVTLQVTTPQESWSAWTGYRESDPRSPVSQFESRVTVVRVENGTLSLDTSDMALLGDQASVSVDGVVRAAGVVGELLGDEQRYIYEDVPMRLEGRADLDLSAGGPGASATGAIEQPGTPWLALAPAGQVDVAETQGLVTERVATAGTSATSTMAWIAGGLFLFGLAAVALARHPILEQVDTLRAELRDRRVRSWMRTGDRLTGVRDYGKALTWYRRVTAKYPEVAEAWYSQGVALTELRRHREAAEAYEHANELLGGDDPELLDLAGTARYRAEDQEAAAEHWQLLAKIEPARLARRLEDPALEGTAVARDLREALGPDEQTVSSYV